MVRTFDKWLAISDPWQPDLTLLHHFGSLPDVDSTFPSPAKRQVRCSPQLAAFITCITTYKKQCPPDPEGALRCLLSSCFVQYNCMFKDGFSPYQLLCSSQLVMDMAFARAVRAACQWLGPIAMPAGYIQTWPPQEPPPAGDAGLGATSSHVESL